MDDHSPDDGDPPEERSRRRDDADADEGLDNESRVE